MSKLHMVAYQAQKLKGSACCWTKGKAGTLAEEALWAARLAAADACLPPRLSKSASKPMISCMATGGSSNLPSATSAVKVQGDSICGNRVI